MLALLSLIQMVVVIQSSFNNYLILGHPEVYVLILPAFGIISHSVMMLAGSQEIFGGLGIVYAILRIGFLGCVV